MKREVLNEWKGCVDVKDYDVEKCISTNDFLHIVHNGETMTLSPKSLKEKRLYVSKPFQSRTGGKDYRLYSYKWEPNKIEDD